MELAQLLHERITREGAITVAEYMELCNTHYYATRDPFGTGGDFTTAPEISQIFGEMIGIWIAQQWLEAGSPHALLCEAGPGRGTLMRDMLRATRHVPQFHAHIRIRLIESSPVLQAIQRRTLKEMHPDLGWSSEVATLPSLPMFFVANEFFDALPVHQFFADGAERTITLRDEKLCWHDHAPVAREASPASCMFLRQIATHIRNHGGAGLIVDYGYTYLPEDANRDTLQAVRRHAYADPLIAPGEADLTAHVDFSTLAQEARVAGVQAWQAQTQGTFLRRMGAELRAAALCKTLTPEQCATMLQGLERLVSPREMGELFKVLALTSSLEKPPAF